MNVVLIYNAKSGGKYDARHLKKLFKDNGVKVTYSFSVRQLSSKKLAALVRRGVTVAVVGGDGTQNAAARVVIGTKSVLLPLPGGTFNHFVRDLGMPPTVEAVLAQIGTAKERMIDVGYVNDDLFLNNSNLGFYPLSLMEQRNTRSLIGKFPSAVLSAFVQFVRFRRHRLTIDGQTVRSPFVFIGNNVFDIQRSLIPSRTGFAKGVLTVMVATSSSRTKLIRSVFGIAGGDVSHINDFTITHPKRLSIGSRMASIPVSFDGEIKQLAPPLEYKVVSKALRVITVKRI